VSPAAESFLRHFERHGPECVLETAERSLAEQDVAALRAFVAGRERVQRWRDGRWVQVRERSAPSCAHCGLDLPAGGSPLARYHRHCARTAAQRRRRDRGRVGAGPGGES
jgi:hypothetical protein